MKFSLDRGPDRIRHESPRSHHAFAAVRRNAPTSRVAVPTGTRCRPWAGQSNRIGRFTNPWVAECATSSSRRRLAAAQADLDFGN